jgi:hypothetical protein
MNVDIVDTDNIFTGTFLITETPIARMDPEEGDGDFEDG